MSNERHGAQYNPRPPAYYPAHRLAPFYGALTDLEMLKVFKDHYGRERHEGSLHARRNELMDAMRIDDTGTRGPSDRSNVQIIKWDLVQNISAEQMQKNYARRLRARGAITHSLTLDAAEAQAFLRAWAAKDWDLIMECWSIALSIPETYRRPTT